MRLKKKIYWGLFGISIIPFSIMILFLVGNLSGTLDLYQVNGSSMNPTLESGDSVLCNNAYRHLEKGDIVVFDKQNSDVSVVHRIHSIHNESLIETKGDANEFVDSALKNKSEIKCKILI